MCNFQGDLGLHWLAVSFELAAKLRRTPIRLSPKTSMASTVASLGIRSLHI
jgi:hypothetical protein